MMFRHTMTKTEVIRVSDGAVIPFSEGNTDYEQYLAWLAEGNTPDPAEVRTVRLAEIDARLKEIDVLKVRPISELLLNPDSAYARDKLTALETEAEALRIERAGLI